MCNASGGAEGVLSKSNLVRHQSDVVSATGVRPDEQIYLPLLGRTNEVIE